MPAYNFKRQFVEKIVRREKRTTIRRRRKRATVAGDRLSLFIGLRTRQCVKFAEATCVKVTPIVIWPGSGLITKHVMGQPFSREKVLEISRNDGFDFPMDMFAFFRGYRHEPLEDFEIIEWDPEELVVVEKAPSPTPGPASTGSARRSTEGRGKVKT